ncbi:cytochrome C biogenesis protein CcmH [Labrys okinawensis]|uniref:Cytochrome c-type biogenesis protein n=1 Tax=Labrys okinawensis TaxID=346911 RepID=A0A2S9QFG3_9HYPH|nr:cytochrome c-type biogenesis protein [Labrys okinawensis]PRH88087.1 cytochrome C biogenesis protein CcmH [Labrys okinawensis]
MVKRFLLACLFGLMVLPALAVQPDEVLPDPALEARARALSAQLRCMVCQNESIDDSNASLAKDLRILVRERLKAGDSDAEVKDFLVARYGDFILLKPPLEWRTLALWSGPPALLLLGGIAIFLSTRRRQAAAPAPLSSDEQARIDDILGRDG